MSNGVTLLNGLEDDVIRNKPKNETELDFDILDQIEQIGFEKDAVKSSVLENKFDPAAGAYYVFGYQKRKDVAAFDKTAKEIAKEPFKKDKFEIKEEINMRGEDETSSALAQLLLQAQRGEDPGSGKPPPGKSQKTGSTKQPIKQPVLGNNLAKTPGIISSNLDPSAVKSPVARKATHESLQRVASKNKKDSYAQQKNANANVPAIQKATIDDNSKMKSQSKERTLKIDETLYTNENSKTAGAHGIPRTIKHAFNCTAATGISPDEIFDKLRFALDSNDTEWTHDKYLFDVVWKSIQMEIEICKIPHMALHGLRFKKISGDVHQFKNQMNELCSTIGIF